MPAGVRHIAGNWNELFQGALNEERAKLGLSAVGSVYGHILTDRPYLAADPIPGPAPPATRDMQILQTGAWLLRDPRPVPAVVEAFLASGPPPIYFGFGSKRAEPDTSRILVESARSVGMRSIISRGWENLGSIDAGLDCLLVDDLPHDKLLSQVAAVVHHGGADTRTVAAGAGVPKLIVPRLYDQYYWAHRVQLLGVGAVVPAREAINVDGITAVLQHCLRRETRDRARSLAHRIDRRGTRIPAEHFIEVINERT